jgi:hypothetical protein
MRIEECSIFGFRNAGFRFQVLIHGARSWGLGIQEFAIQNAEKGTNKDRDWGI